MSDLTVEKVRELGKWGILTANGVDTPLPEAGKDYGPYKIYEFLLSRIDEIEKETAEKCALIASMRDSITARKIRKHFGTSEE